MNDSPAVDLDHHRRLRAILREHQNGAAGTCSAAAFRRAAKEFGLLEGNQLGLESDEELIILVDHVIYDRPDRGKTAVRRYLSKLPKADDPDERAVRDAMAGHRYSVFRVEAVHAGTGLALCDLVRGDRLFVVDEAMSGTIARGATLSTRVLPLPDYWLTSGAGFPISAEGAALVESIFRPALELAEDEPPAVLAKLPLDLAVMAIGTGFMEGSTGRVGYR
jgi:hypothetical protein